MENAASFDLNQALAHWRANLQNLGGFSAADLEELEGHLRESISALHERGLSVEEAFVVATRRLGSERQLAEEFGKANPQRVWTERAMWMVAGLLAADTLRVIAQPFPNMVLACASRSGLNGHLPAALSLLTGWIVWWGGLVIVYWMLSRRSSRRDRVVQACLQRPVWTGLGLFLGLESLHYFMRNVLRWAEPAYVLFGGPEVGFSAQTIAILNRWFLWAGLLQEVVWIAAVPLLAGYAWRKRQKPVAPGSPGSHELQPGEGEAARALQGQGLSLHEAGLVLARRRGAQAVVSRSLAHVTDRGIWMERAVWMVTGVALIHWLEQFVLSPAWILAAATGSAAPLLQHLAALGSVGLGLAVAAAIVAGLWRWIARHPSQSASIGRVCLRRPALAAIVLVGICAGFGFGEYALFTYVVRPANLGVGAIGSQWLTYRGALTHLLIPIALLLWLARRWQKFGANAAVGA